MSVLNEPPNVITGRVDLPFQRGKKPRRCNVVLVTEDRVPTVLLVRYQKSVVLLFVTSPTILGVEWTAHVPGFLKKISLERLSAIVLQAIREAADLSEIALTLPRLLDKKEQSYIKARNGARLGCKKKNKAAALASISLRVMQKPLRAAAAPVQAQRPLSRTTTQHASSDSGHTRNRFCPS